MSREKQSIAVIATGVLCIVAGIYGWFGANSITLAGIGFVICILGGGLLLSTQSSGSLITPHPYVYVPVAMAVLLHGYENLALSADGFSTTWFLWALFPYGLVLALSCFKGTRKASIAGAVVALLVDGLVHYDVFISPQSSTAALALIWIPIWNTILFVPVATMVARLIIRRKTPGSDCSSS
jgi:hypothetical protein